MGPARRNDGLSPLRSNKRFVEDNWSTPNLLSSTNRRSAEATAAEESAAEEGAGEETAALAVVCYTGVAATEVAGARRWALKVTTAPTRLRHTKTPAMTAVCVALLRIDSATHAE